MSKNFEQLTIRLFRNDGHKFSFFPVFGDSSWISNIRMALGSEEVLNVDSIVSINIVYTDSNPCMLTLEMKKGQSITDSFYKYIKENQKSISELRIDFDNPDLTKLFKKI